MPARRIGLAPLDAHDVDTVQTEVHRIVERVQSFADELRGRGIHVGLGHPARCVSCDQPWPCTHATNVSA